MHPLRLVSTTLLLSSLLLPTLSFGKDPTKGIMVFQVNDPTNHTRYWAKKTNGHCLESHYVPTSITYLDNPQTQSAYAAPKSYSSGGDTCATDDSKMTVTIYKDQSQSEAIAKIKFEKPAGKHWRPHTKDIDDSVITLTETQLSNNQYSYTLTPKA